MTPAALADGNSRHIATIPAVPVFVRFGHFAALAATHHFGRYRDKSGQRTGITSQRAGSRMRVGHISKKKPRYVSAAVCK
jgi:hypothetical protein